VPDRHDWAADRRLSRDRAVAAGRA